MCVAGPLIDHGTIKGDLEVFQPSEFMLNCSTFHEVTAYSVAPVRQWSAEVKLSSCSYHVVSWWVTVRNVWCSIQSRYISLSFKNACTYCTIWQIQKLLCENNVKLHFLL